MSESKTWTTSTENIWRAVELYIATDKPRVADVAKAMGATPQNVRCVLRRALGPERYKAEKALRYSRASVKREKTQDRTGEKNAMWKGGTFISKDGYRMVRVGNTSKSRYHPEHRVIMAKALGLAPGTLPRKWEVHHIDENKLNNNMDNLALVTGAAHQHLHTLMAGWLRGSYRSPLWDQWESGISKLPETIPTLPKDS